MYSFIFISLMRTRTIIPFLLFFSVSFSASTQNLDIDILKSINPETPNSKYWEATSASAYYFSAAVPVGLFVAGIIKKDDHLKFSSYEVVGSIAAAAIVTRILKWSIDRPRPAQKYPGEVFPYEIKDGKSFPSGHTSLAFATATSISLQYKKWYIVVPSCLWAASVGYSRMYLGVHYPSDVLAGAAIGVGSAFLSHWFTRKFFSREAAESKDKKRMEY